MSDTQEDLSYLKGRDPTENIVGCHPTFEDDGTYMRVYFRDGSSVHYDDFQFWPFFFANEKAARIAHECSVDMMIKPLDGGNKYDFLVVGPEWSDTQQVLNLIYNKLGYPEPELDEDGQPDYNHRLIEEVYTAGSITTQFMMQSGKTFFKGMEFEDVHRMQIDIETYTEGGFPNASREEDKITIISMTDNRGFEQVLHLDRKGISHPKGRSYDTEANMLHGFVDLIKHHDPDVIEGYNLYNFDLPYIRDRAGMWGVPLSLGRNGEEPFFFDSSRTFAERTIDYEMCSIPGRSIIDGYFQVLAFDVYARDMPSHTLKAAAKYFDVVPDGRTYVEGDQIPRMWREEPQTLLDYALDDVRETRAVCQQLSGSTFYLTQMLPFAYQDADRYGTATTIEALMTREYLRQRQSVPEPTEGKQSTGGYTDIYVQGVIDRLVYADVSSLYPAIMLNYRCEPGPKKDPIELFYRCLQQLTNLRLDAKGELADTREAISQVEENMADIPDSMPNPDKGKIRALEQKRDELDARQSSYKILINSFYGAMGFQLFAWNNISEADRVAETGQEILKYMIREIEKDGGTVVEVDTDGVIFTPTNPETGKNEMGLPDNREAEAQYVRDLTERMPEGIEIDWDGSFQRALSYKKKNYALRSYDGKVKLKGGSIISRSMEKFGRDFVSEVIDALLNKDVQRVHDVYTQMHDTIVNSKWGVEDFQRTETLKDTYDEYKRKVELGPGNGGYNRYARYEVAIKEMKRTGKEWEIGDRVDYYIAQSGQSLNKMKSFRAAKLADHYDPDNPDEYTEYYIKDRLERFTKKFAPFFDQFSFRQVFSTDDGLFGFDPSNVNLKTNRIRQPLLNSPDDVQEVPEPVQ